MTTTPMTPAPVVHDPQRDVRLAWLSMLLVPFAFLAAFGVGEGLASLFGWPVGGTETPPLWVMVAATGPALLVFAVPAVVSGRFARRAARSGNRKGWVPAILIVIAVLFALMNLLAPLLGG